MGTGTVLLARCEIEPVIRRIAAIEHVPKGPQSGTCGGAHQGAVASDFWRRKAVGHAVPIRPFPARPPRPYKALILRVDRGAAGLETRPRRRLAKTAHRHRKRSDVALLLPMERGPELVQRCRLW